MTIYVDPLMNHGWILRGNQVMSCHLFTDAVDLEPLHALASSVGCKRAWFQESERAPHYDLTDVRRLQAVRAGAVEVDRREAAGIWRYRSAMVRAAGRLLHDWDDDAICTFCGFDGAEDAHLNQVLRAQVGEGEFQSRLRAGEFDAGRYCDQRTDQAKAAR